MNINPIQQIPSIEDSRTQHCLKYLVFLHCSTKITALHPLLPASHPLVLFKYYKWEFQIYNQWDFHFGASLMLRNQPLWCSPSARKYELYSRTFVLTDCNVPADHDLTSWIKWFFICFTVRSAQWAGGDQLSRHVCWKSFPWMSALTSSVEFIICARLMKAELELTWFNVMAWWADSSHSIQSFSGSSCFKNWYVSYKDIERMT